MKRLVPILAACLTLAACGSKPRPPAAAAAAPRAAPVAAPAEEKKPDDGPPKEEWSYSSAGKRDPFRSYLKELDAPQGGIASRCSTPLGRFDVEQLHLVAVITGLEDPVAMVEAPNGVGYSVRRGSCIGKNGGVISAVRNGELVVSEWAIRADGTRDKSQTVLKLPQDPSLQIEE
jgi:type IV pilus assembly protein PilP